MAKTAAEKAAAAKKNGKNPASAANSTGGKAPKKDLATKAARQAYTKQPVKNNGGGAVNKDGTPRRAHKFRPGTVALRQIRRYQSSTELLIPRAPFARLVREIMADRSSEVTRIQQTAFGALQEATETYISKRMEAANYCAIHGNRITIMKKDFELTDRILDVMDGYRAIDRDDKGSLGTIPDPPSGTAGKQNSSGGGKRRRGGGKYVPQQSPNHLPDNNAQQPDPANDNEVEDEPGPGPADDEPVPGPTDDEDEPGPTGENDEPGPTGENDEDDEAEGPNKRPRLHLSAEDIKRTRAAAAILNGSTSTGNSGIIGSMLQGVSGYMSQFGGDASKPQRPTSR